MKKFAISPVGRSTSEKLIKQHLRKLDRVVKKHTCGEHTVRVSEMREYVKAAYFRLSVSGPRQEIVNEFLEHRMIVSHFFIPKINTLVVEELIPSPKRIFDVVAHRIRFDTGATRRIDLRGYRVKGVRTNTAELIVQRGQSESSERQWSLFDLHRGGKRPIYRGGNEFYLSADGDLFFPVENWSRIGMVDLVSGKPLDAKNKRHFSRYATQVKMLQVIHFAPEEPSLFVILMKQQELSSAKLKKEVCIKLSVTD